MASVSLLTDWGSHFFVTIRTLDSHGMSGIRLAATAGTVFMRAPISASFYADWIAGPNVLAATSHVFAVLTNEVHLVIDVGTLGIRS